MERSWTQSEKTADWTCKMWKKGKTKLRLDIGISTQRTEMDFIGLWILQIMKSTYILSLSHMQLTKCCPASISQISKQDFIYQSKLLTTEKLLQMSL